MAARDARQVHELDRHNQQLLDASPQVRQQFMSKLDTSSLAKYGESSQWYRQYFADRSYRKIRSALVTAPRRVPRLSYDEPKYTRL